MPSSTGSGAGASGRRFDLAALLDAARAVFATQGYSAAQITQIAAAAGTTKPTLYARVGNKEEIYLAVVRREAEVFQQQIAAAYQRGGDLPVEELAEVGMEPLFRFARDRREGFQLLFRGDEAGGQVAPIRRGVLDGVTEMLATMIRDRRQRFGRPGGANSELLAAACVGLARQVCEWAMDRGDDLTDAQHLAARFAAGAIRDVEVDGRSTEKHPAG